MPPLILSDKAHITQGDLPHWDDKKAIYFATFRLADSLPITAMKEFRAWEEDKLESLNHGNVATTAWEEFERERRKQIQNAPPLIIVLPSWGIEPQLDNADAGTRLLIK